ncbi:hypothetical protein V6N13_033122 [Hibiscus sabdariffa]
MMERLNSFRLFGSKISVTIARYKTRQSFWRKKGNRQSHTTAVISDKITNQNSAPVAGKPEEDKEGGASSGKRGNKSVRICDHIEPEDLWKLKKCLVGEMGSVCTVESIHKRLEAWDMGDKRKVSDCKPASSSSSSSETNSYYRRDVTENVIEVEEEINEENVGKYNMGDRAVESSKEISSGKRVLIQTKQIEEEGENSKKQKQRWASILSRKVSTKGETKNLSVEQEEWRGSSNGEVNYRNVERVFFPEFEPRKNPKKRYGSLKCLQDLAISEKEKKKRDRAIRRRTKQIKGGRKVRSARKLENRIDDLEEVGSEGYAALNRVEEMKDCKLKLWDTLKLKD